MTTSHDAGCYVYHQLPESLEVVTCGRYEQQGEVGRFAYAPGYLANPRAVELEPFELLLRPDTFETPRLGGIFGVLRDSSPDAWGRAVLQALLRRTDLSELDFLLHSPDDRAGALSFGRGPTPPATVQPFNPFRHLDLLLDVAARIEQDLPPFGRQNSIQVNAATGIGGARPKNVVEDEEGLWIAKFPSRRDRWNNAAVECAMLRLARECGLRAASGKRVQVAGLDVLLVRRFDRRHVEGGYVRHRMVSALTVFRAEEDPQDRSKWSYLLLADELKRRVANPEEDLRELFSRMVFNALISNIDDHPRNHALIAEGSEWRLSPVYDLTPMPQVSTERDLAMEVGSAQHRRANRRNLLSECGRFYLSREDATHLLDRMKAHVSARWRDAVKECGGTEADLRSIERAFDYEGFEYGSED